MTDKDQENTLEAPEAQQAAEPQAPEAAPASVAPAEAQAQEQVQAPPAEPAAAQPPAEPAAPAETAQPEAEEQGPSQARVIPISNLEVGRLMQLDACTRCGECLNWCPIHDQDPREAILPRQKLADFLDIIKRQHGPVASLLRRGGGLGLLGRVLASLSGHRPVSEEEVQAFVQNLYECSTCGQCQIVCPANLDTVNLWENIRESIVRADYGPLEPQTALVKSVKSYDNPWQQPKAARTKWARRAKKEGLITEEPPAIKKKGGKILLYLGCTAAFDSNVRDIALDTVNILEHLGVDYGVLGKDEKCCGSVMLRMGDPEFQRIASQNIADFNSLGIEALVTSCAGCFKTIKEDYPKVGRLNFEVLHTVEFLRRLAEQGQLKFDKPVERVITYHDPCHLGRASGVFDDPRYIMEAIPGLELVEMPRSRQYSRCCGAGGGVKAGFPDIQNKMAQERVREAMATGAQELVSACPFCFQGLQVGIGALESPLKMRDLTHLVKESLGDS